MLSYPVFIQRWMGMLDEFGRFWQFIAQVWVSLLLPGQGGRGSEARGRFLTQMFEIGTKSVPVVMITGGFVGMTLAVQTYSQLRGMGLQERLGVLLNISVVKELGPVLAAVMLAGRVGGAMTAELGTMHVTEQIDALRAMGAEPIRHLVLPRFLACILLTPILTIYADLLGVVGGYVISVWHFGINSEAYWRFSAEGVEKWDVMTGVLKGVFFGSSIAMISCFKGFYCGRGARGVGKACTEAFVGSFISILILDFMLAVIFKAIYESLWTSRMLI